MQISAANLLLAGQQARAPHQQPRAGFDAVLQGKMPEPVADGFESLAFKQAAPAAKAAPAAAAPAQPYAATRPPGSQIDIRV